MCWETPSNGINLFAQFHFINARIVNGEKKEFKIGFNWLLESDMIRGIAHFVVDRNLDANINGIVQTTIQLERYIYSAQFDLKISISVF